MAESPRQGAAHGSPFRVGEWEAEPGLNEVRGPGGAVRVESLRARPS